ncbi:unnamed protein product [Ceutorhynchus assimilis]|uniref:Peptidase S1 domain-containing protein n=1 Tax=Ceutorhynchus assimilis TaxID=467358 RepID=A0A9N9MW08_9CUCU|nr:unnamed protein product [Ceutorhynchus assimilis]
MWKCVLLLIAVAAYCSRDDPSVSEKRPLQNVNFLVEVVRKDTKERVAVGTLLSPTRVLTSAKSLVLSPWRYEAHLEVRARQSKRFNITAIIAAIAAASIGGAVSASMLGGKKITSRLLNNGDITILSIQLPYPDSRSALTFVKLLIPSDIRSPKSSWPSEWHTAQFKLADTPCKKATVLGWKQSATVDIIGAKKCAEQLNLQLNDGQFCSLNERKLFCDANQQGGPIMCGDFQVGILIPERYCNGTEKGLPGEPLQFSPIGYYIDGIVRAMETRKFEMPPSNDEPTVTNYSEEICMEPYTNIFVLLLFTILSIVNFYLKQ